MYTIELTREERRAIDWIGDRYAHGDGLFRVLLEYCSWCCPYPEIEDAEWHDNVPLEFSVPEAAAWKIKEIVEQDNLACFSTSLVRKLQNFVSNIV